MKNLILLILILVYAYPLQAQSDPEFDASEKSKLNIGFGGGIDYGGFGVRGGYLMVPAFGVFAGAGYNLNNVGFNAGANYFIPVGKKNQLYLSAMYGYNAVLLVKGDLEDKATYYGVSGGVGFQLNSSKNNNFWNFELLLPIRNSNFREDIDWLKSVGADVKEPYPVSISAGYHIRFPQLAKQ